MSSSRGVGRAIGCVVLALAVGLPAGLVPTGLASAAEPDHGHPGPTYATGSGSPSGSKPQSKLWHAAGSWWAVMWDDATADFHIFRLDVPRQSWVDTGVRVDERSGTRADVLWDGTTLYIASHQYTTSASSTGTSRLYTYTLSGNTWVQQGSPSTINRVKTETLVIDKDSIGDLWATWVETTSSTGTVKVARRPAGQSAWQAPFTVPGTDAIVNPDDISALVRNGTSIDVVWSDQDSGRFGFARHVAGAPSGTWTAETAAAGANLVDDHISLVPDGGQLYALVKGGDDAVRLLHRAANGTWNTPTTVWEAAASATRGILLLDTASQVLRAYATGPTPPKTSGQAGGTIYEKVGALSTRAFPTGKGTPIIQDADVGDMNNPSSTKQALTASTGVVVLATQDSAPRRYWHHHALLGPTTTTTSTTTTTTTTTTIPTPTTTTTTTTPDGPVTFVPTADAYVRSDQTAKNYGTDTALRIRNGSISHMTYLTFDVSGLAPGAKSAVLRLYVTDDSPDGGAVHTVASSWNESTITWGNAPATSTSPIEQAGATPPVGSWMTVDVTAAVGGNGTYRFALASTSSNSALYSVARERTPHSSSSSIPDRERTGGSSASSRSGARAPRSVS